MNFEIVRLKRLSGGHATIYTVLIAGERNSLLENFIQENDVSHKAEVQDILQRLFTIGHHAGAKEYYFKHNEGIPGDGVCALFDLPDKDLRLYCIRYGTCVVILGGGGLKPRGMRALQDSPKLTEENYKVREISAKIMNRIKEGELYWKGEDLEGDFKFYEDEEY